MSESPAKHDALLLLRQSIASDTPPVPTTSSEPGDASSVEQNLARATHLQFNHDGHTVLPLSTPTRFESSEKPVDLRSILFAWLNKDAGAADYINATTRLNDELGQDGSAGGSVQNLVFAEKLDLNSWLDGSSEDTEFIKPLDAEEQSRRADAAAEVAAGVKSTGETDRSGAAREARAAKQPEARLREIYRGERKMGDSNTVLRGIKPTVCTIILVAQSVYFSLQLRQGLFTRAQACPSISRQIARQG